MRARKPAALRLAARRFHNELQPRDVFLLVGLTWVRLPGFGAWPPWRAVPDLSVTHAYCEAMSGFTATGATVLTGLDGSKPVGLTGTAIQDQQARRNHWRAPVTALWCRSPFIAHRRSGHLMPGGRRP